MQSSSGTCLQKAVRTLVGAAFFMPALWAPLPAAAAGFDSFLETFYECDPVSEGVPFELFMRSVSERYGNIFSETPQAAAEDTSIQLEIPADLVSNIGPIASKNAGDHTRLSIPLQGSFEGLPLQKLEVALGNENGINAMVLIFNTPHARVQGIFGSLIARGNAKGEAHSENGAGYSATIPQDNPGRILCDWST